MQSPIPPPRSGLACEAPQDASWMRTTTTNKPRYLLVASAISLAITCFGVGCGNAPGVSRKKPLAIAVYRARANAICRQLHSGPRGAPSSRRQAIRWFRRYYPAAIRDVDELAALRSPPEFAAEHKRAVRLLQQEMTLDVHVLHEMELGLSPAEAVAAVSPKLRPVLASENAAFRALGLKECARD